MNKIKLKSKKGAMVILAILGLLISIYLTTYHFLGVPLACSTSGLINCNNVINSPYGYIFGIPVAVYGIAFFIAELIVLYFIKDIFAKVFLNGIGVIGIVYFLYSEYMVGNICEYCTAVHLITITLFILSVYLYKKKL